MSETTIRLSSRAIGERRRVIVHVYRDAEALRAAARRWNPDQDWSDTVGACHAYVDEAGAVTVPVVRLCRQHLGMGVISHELHHAASGIYGSTLTTEPAAAVLTHFNEPYAHLFSDLARRLVVALHEHGYYRTGEDA